MRLSRATLALSRWSEVKAIQQPDHLSGLPASTARCRDLSVVQDS